MTVSSPKGPGNRGPRRGVPTAATLPADLNADGLINDVDLGTLLGQWGSCPGYPADLDNDGVVNNVNLGLLLGAWCSGVNDPNPPCPPDFDRDDPGAPGSASLTCSASWPLGSVPVDPKR